MLQDSKNIIRGQSKFISDISLPGLIESIIITAPLHKGTFEIQNFPEMPKGYICLSYKDIPGKNIVSFYSDKMPFLAPGKFNYKGEPICLICGPEKRKLNKIAANINIKFQEQEPLLLINNFSKKDIFDTKEIIKGNIKNAFSHNYKIIKGEYKTGFEEYYFTESPSVIALWKNRKLTIYCATKNPLLLRNNIALLLKIAPRQISIIIPESAQNPGENETLNTLISGHASLLSFYTGNPVKVTYKSTIKRYASLIMHKTAITEQGAPLGSQVEIYMDAGAYRITYPNFFHRAVYTALGAYKFQNIKIKAYLIHTNKTPFSQLLNIGAIETFFAVELHTSKIAAICGINPYIWKHTFLAVPSISKKKKQKFETSVHEILDDVAKRSDFNRKYSAYKALSEKKENANQYNYIRRGIGLALYFFGYDFIDEYKDKGKYLIKLLLNKKDNLKIIVNTGQIERDLKLILKSIALKILNLPPQNISVESLQISTGSTSGPLYETSAITNIGKLVEEACFAILAKKNKSKSIITVTKSYWPSTETKIKREIFSSDEYSSLAWCATVIEVEIDPVSLQVYCRGIWTSIEAGTILIPSVAHIHVEKEILRGLSSATYSEQLLDHKYRKNQNFPPLYINFIEKHYTQGPLGAKGIGILPSLGIPAAYVAAVSQAFGYDFSNFPLKPQNMEIGEEI